MIMKTLNLTNQNIYNIADTKTKKMIDTYIEELKEQGLLTGIFGILSTNIHKRTRVKNSEILEIFIYGAYIEEQSKLDKYEKQIIKEDMNYYYQQGQEEVIKAQKKKKETSIIPDAIFLTLLDMQSTNGFNLNQNIQATIQYNAQQLYKQALIYIQQQKTLEIENNEFQKIIAQQNNNKLCINGEKISGMMDNQLIGLNNMAKVEGMLQEDNNARVRFITIIDGKETDMCHSLDGQIFYINKQNEFNRYYGETKSDLRIQRIKCFGVVLGLNLPPISHHFHWCRSTITYQVPPAVEKATKTEYNNMELPNYIIKRDLQVDNIENERKELYKAINKLTPKIKNLLLDTTFELGTDGLSRYDRKKDYLYIRKGADKYEILHEIGHAVETKLKLLNTPKYEEIQKNLAKDSYIIKSYDFEKEIYIIKNDKLISDYQGCIYIKEIKEGYENGNIRHKLLGEVFSEGFREYYQNPLKLKHKNKELYNYIKENI